MSDVLNKICEDKRTYVVARKQTHPMDMVEAAAKEAAPPRGFRSALGNAVDAGGYGLIAEIKKASPSKGLIREDFDPATLAGAYQAGGATCLSVLTDTPYFQGHDGDLIEAWTAAVLPVLRKDFMVDPYQIVESRALGADCVLLILAALDDAEARDFEALAFEYGLDVLAEVHDSAELERALKLKTPLIGINNRNLKTFDVDLSVTLTLLNDIPSDRIVVSESGLSTPEDLARLSDAGVNCFLIGEFLMRQDDVEAATRALLSPLAAESARA
ncbi:MAG: indole-3-glycerol phosphate synthase TrpC [Rhodospirillales bacterium]|nr:indole-3-glycerol phosphate synthase TrpC [Rhodospirillales bacterium]